METVWWGLFLLALPGSFFRIPILWPGVAAHRLSLECPFPLSLLY